MRCGGGRLYLIKQGSLRTDDFQHATYRLERFSLAAQWFVGGDMKFKYACQCGAQIIEFAFVLPILLLFLLLIIDFGFIVYNKAVITNASREAARYGTVLAATPWSTSSVAAVACNYAKNSLIGLKSGTHTSTCTGSADPSIVVSNPNGNVPPQFSDPITVVVTYSYSGFLLNSNNPKYGIFPLSLKSSSTMNHE